MLTIPRRLARISPDGLGRLLLVSFGLTVLSFVMASAVSDTLGRGIASAATSIAGVTVPTATHISRMLAQIDRQTLLMDEITERLDANEKIEPLQAMLGQSRSTLTAEWKAVQSFPALREEQETFNGITDDLATLEASADQLLQEAARHDPASQRTVTEALRPTISRLDVELRGLGDLNRQRATELSTQIAGRLRHARSWGRALTALCALFTCLTAFVVVSVVQSYVRSAQTHVTELEIFSGRVAHDIRSPLTSVGLALDLARRTPQLESSVRAILDRGTRTMQQVGQMVDGLLVFARAGAPPDASERAPVKEIVDDVVQALRPTAEEKVIDLQVEPSEPFIAACHPGVLTSIVSNLVGNALKYMGDVSIRHIDLRVRGVGNRVRLEVADTGPGVPRDMRERIFYPHVRAASAAIPGLGLGLATVRRLAEAHGGAAGVVSSGGEGSIFWVELPQAA